MRLRTWTFRIGAGVALVYFILYVLADVFPESGLLASIVWDLNPHGFWLGEFVQDRTIGETKVPTLSWEAIGVVVLCTVMFLEGAAIGLFVDWLVARLRSRSRT